MDAHVSQVVKQVTEVPKTPSPDRTVQCTVEQILDVLVPEMVKQLVEVPKTVSQDTIQQRNVEQIVDVPVPQVVEELEEVFKVSPQDRIEHHSFQQTIETRASSLTEKIVEMPVTQTQEKTRQVANTHVQHDVDTVEVEIPQFGAETGRISKLILGSTHPSLKQRCPDLPYSTARSRRFSSGC